MKSTSYSAASYLIAISYHVLYAPTKKKQTIVDLSLSLIRKPYHGEPSNTGTLQNKATHTVSTNLKRDRADQDICKSVSCAYGGDGAFEPGQPSDWWGICLSVDSVVINKDDRF